MTLRTAGLVLLLAVGVPAPPEPFQDDCLVGKENPYNPKTLKPVPVFKVDMADPPFVRWQAIVKQYDKEVHNLLQVIKNFTGPLFHGKVIDFVDKYLGGWDNKLPTMYAEELKGIANVTNMKLGEIVLYNLFYEIHSACTAIIARDKNNKLWHGRNMDFGMFLGWDIEKHRWTLTEMLRAASIQVEFVNNGKATGIHAFTYAGFVGVFEGMKDKLFSVSMNTRFDFKHGGIIQIIEWLLHLTPKNVKFTTFNVRDALFTAKTFEEAKQQLITTPIMGPCYYILGGVAPDEGVVVARAPRAVAALVELGKTPTDKWYLLQTNYDPQKKPLYLDDRRTPGHNCMNKVGQVNLTKEAIFTVLSSKTNLNKQTVITTLSQAESGVFETYIQYCADPCWFA